MGKIIIKIKKKNVSYFQKKILKNLKIILFNKSNKMSD